MKTIMACFNLRLICNNGIVGFKVMMIKSISCGFDKNMELINQNVCNEGVKFFVQERKAIYLSRI